MTVSKNAGGHTFAELYDAAIEPNLAKSTTHLACPECDGEGRCEYERAVPMSNSNPYGYLEDYWAECENCGGTGIIEADYEDED